MNIPILIALSALSLTSCHCAELVCDGRSVAGGGRSEDEDPEVEFTLAGRRGFYPDWKTSVIVHGFAFEHQWAYDMAEKWLRREPINVLVVSWPTNFFKVGYQEAAYRTRGVAKKIKEYVMELVLRYGDRLNRDFHFVGHSLGAHVAGQAARMLGSSGVEVRRVTGLDPAHPCFETSEASYRLRGTDARFVDVIHTNSGQNASGGKLGTYDLLGQVDFYPNGGDKQPGCWRENCRHVFECAFHDVQESVRSVAQWFSSAVALAIRLFSNSTMEMDRIVKNVIETEANCDHGESIVYFVESLAGKKLWANPTEWPVRVTPKLQCRNRACDNRTCVEMGINAELYGASGVYYVDASFGSIECAGLTRHRGEPKFSVFPENFARYLLSWLGVR